MQKCRSHTFCWRVTAAFYLQLFSCTHSQVARWEALILNDPEMLRLHMIGELWNCNYCRQLRSRCMDISKCNCNSLGATWPKVGTENTRQDTGEYQEPDSSRASVFASDVHLYNHILFWQVIIWGDSYLPKIRLCFPLMKIRCKFQA